MRRIEKHCLPPIILKQTRHFSVLYLEKPSISVLFFGETDNIGIDEKMSCEPKEQAIKLFGKTILLPEIAGSGSDWDERFEQTSSQHEEHRNKERENDQETLEESLSGSHDHHEDEPRSSSSMENSTNSKLEDEHSETSESSDQKPLKKPDRILPCPRCKSKETKFCYYNNYNANQPRYFCKNCQRYWTAGGTMRNVPVGAGRRMTKTSTTHHCQRNVPETLARISVGFDRFQFYRVAASIGAPMPVDSAYSGLNPQTLGKHPRNNNEEALKAEKCLKIQRIDDPGEAAKSSIWTSLGFKKETVDSVSRNCFGEAFDRRFLRANPAALSRSFNFNESS